MLGQRKTIGGILWVGVGGGTESYFPSSISKQCNWKKISTKSRTFCYFGNISKYCPLYPSPWNLELDPEALGLVIICFNLYTLFSYELAFTKNIFHTGTVTLWFVKLVTFMTLLILYYLYLFYYVVCMEINYSQVSSAAENCQ